jgi:putative oxidoreductase
MPAFLGGHRVLGAEIWPAAGSLSPQYGSPFHRPLDAYTSAKEFLMREKMYTVMLAVNRALLGALLLLAGIGKFEKGVGVFYDTVYKGLVPSWLPNWFASPYGYAVPFLEVLVGGVLILGLFGRISALVAAFLIGSFTIALATHSASGNVFSLGGQSPIHANYFFVALALLLACAGPGCCTLDQLWRKSGKAKPAGQKN